MSKLLLGCPGTTYVHTYVLNKYSQSCKPSFLGASNAKILAFDRAHKKIANPILYVILHKLVHIIQLVYTNLY
jgi:hypothetical protein